MKQKWRWILAVSLGCLAIAIAFESSNFHREQLKVASQEVRFQKTFERVQSEYPVGSPRAMVESRITSEFQQVDHLTPELLYVSLGREDSQVWYCNFWKEELELTFSSGAISDQRLLGVKRRAIGECL